MRKALVATALVFSLILPLVLSTQEAHAANRDGVHGYIGVGLLLGFASFRVGYKDWEVGMLNTGIVGIDKVFRSSDSSSYAAFGVGVNLGASDPAFYAALGYDWELFWGLGLRTELSAGATVLGYTFGEILAGMSWGF